MKAFYLALLLLSVAFVSVCTTWIVRQKALSRGIIDYPNSRSSHSRATPRGGGLAIALAATSGMAFLWSVDVVDTSLLMAILLGGSAIAGIGYLDDRRSVSVRARVAVHLVGAIWAIFILNGLPPIQLGTALVDLGLVGDALAVLAIVWSLNLFNFMDGIDGIAASEAAFVCAGGAVLCYSIGASPGVSAAALVVAAASVGFLIWNWSPAKIFMGDVGSGYLGYVAAVLAVAAARESTVALLGWFILGSVFFVDATVTLLRRLARGERVHEAHRTHAYQWLARRWRSHGRVTSAIALVNLVWLLPCALFATLFPSRASWIVLLALVPVVTAGIAFGSGRREEGG